MCDIENKGSVQHSLAQRCHTSDVDDTHKEHRSFESLRRFDEHNLEDCLSHGSTSTFRSNLEPALIFRLIRCYQKFWLQAPEDARAGRSCESTTELAHILNEIKKTYTGLIHFLPRDKQPAISGARSSRSISHGGVYDFVREFWLPLPPPKQRNHIVAIALPTGPMLALACFAVSAYHTAAPLGSTIGSEQFENEIIQLQATAILIRKEDLGKLNINAPWILANSISVISVVQNEDMTFGTSIINNSTRGETALTTANTADDIALVLFTSGTSGQKKIVPITLHTILTGVAFVIDSWGLRPEDCCLNMMPLNHIGGLIRNLFAPVIAGGSTICCPSFDPSLFWDLCENRDPTWYYASPTMHSLILAESVLRPVSRVNKKIRLVCNAAGGLLPSLATNLRQTFQCTVLPSYGMTECMPIATPPLTYSLERSGTSGKSVGPEISIMGFSGYMKLSSREVGRICVRGPPVFSGYLGAELDQQTVSTDGWFDTGDLGYMDEDNYLYVTGRGKEVINRGGEIISPFEIEDAILNASQSHNSPIFEKISEAMAFSLPHDILQEAVGVALVMHPGKLRPDLRQLHRALEHSLNQPKWPVGIVYMDALPKARGKILRIQMAERLGLPQFTDEIPASGRYFEAECPELDTPVTKPIPSRPCIIDLKLLKDAIDRELLDTFTTYVCHHGKTGMPRAFLFCPNLSVNVRVIMDTLEARLQKTLDGYLLPRSIEYIEGEIPWTPDGKVDEDSLLIGLKERLDTVPEIEAKVREAFCLVLRCLPEEINRQSDFFHLGGDSLKAGRFSSLLRKELQIQFPSNTLFTNSTVGSICDIIEQNSSIEEESGSEGLGCVDLPGPTRLYSSTNPFLLITQLLPIAIVYPMRQAFQWMVFLWIVTVTVEPWPFYSHVAMRLLHLTVSLLMTRLVSDIVCPLIAIFIKWIVIGCFKEGLYPMWGPYHTRWWFVHKVILIGGKGIFKHFDWSIRLYYRLLGTKIGKGVVIHKSATLGEYDLLDIGDNAILDDCICRPFAVERNTSMLLKRINIGSNSTIGLKAVIAPGTNLAPNTCIGPNSSSWEVQDATEANRDLLSSKIPQPHWAMWLFIVIPVVLAVQGMAGLPWMAGLVGMVLTAPHRSGDGFRQVAIWFASPVRIGYHYLARILGITFGPLILLIMIFLVKRTLDLFRRGENPEKSCHPKKVQFAIMDRLIPNGDPKILADLFGSHYEITSVVIRLLGGRVGARVYWPGVGPNIQDFSLVNIGNDVVFGSRSHLITSDGISSEQLVIGDGVMVADRTVMLPGTEVGRDAILGTGTLTQRNGYYPPDSVWIGSKAGEAVCLKTGARKSHESTRKLQHRSTLESDNSFPEKNSVTKADRELDANRPSGSAITPYGKALYQGEAPYHVFGISTIFLYSTFINISSNIYWHSASIVGVKIIAVLLESSNHLFRRSWFRPYIIYSLMTGTIATIMTMQALLALIFIVATKWILLGRRQPGRYDWDESSYCQRWQLFLTIEKLRSKCYRNNGIIKLISGTHFLVLYFRAMGAKIGKDCALFAGGQPSVIFTEPDLLTIGDRVAVDDASLVCHLNTRGKFSLHSMSVGDRSVLRTGSRLLAGAQMMEDACLLEHSLIMSGDVVEPNETHQGWPASLFKGKRV